MPSMKVGPETYGLPVAPKSSVQPELVLSHQTVDDLVKSRITPDTLFITDEYNYPQLKALGARVEKVADTTPEAILKILNLPDYPRMHYIVGVGGCAALDSAKAAAVGKECSVIPTVLSTNCITKNRSVIHDGENAFSYQTATPSQVVVSLEDLSHQPESIKERWSGSGFGDYFAKIAAVLDQEAEAGRPGTEAALRKSDPELMNGLDWVNDNFKGYDKESLGQLASLAHDAGLKVVHAGRNDKSVGGEHKFYYAAVGLYPHLRSLPTHGQLVAIGTLITTRVMAEKSGDFTLHNKVEKAFQKLGLPTTQPGLDRLGVTREVTESCLARIGQPDHPWSVLGQTFKNGDFGLLDRLFGEPESAWNTVGLA